MKTRYFHDTKKHNLDSPKSIAPIIYDIFKPKSVVDFGCGLGTWIKVFKDLGVEKVLGFDGSWVDKNKFESSVLEFFKESDLEKDIEFEEKFELALSLEVAEHLKRESADTFVKNLVKSSDTIIFSAAIPLQGGQNHINEQPLSYWVNLFKKHDFKLYDILRGRIWDMENVFWWYKQNMVVFSKNNIKTKEVFPIDIVHPELLKQYYDSPYYIKKYL